MNLYLVSRWGADMFSDELNADLETTKDSNLLVRAETWESAIKIANSYLVSYLGAHQHFAEALKNGHELCNFVAQIAVDPVSETEEVIHGPFLSHAIIKGDNVFPKWQYQSIDNTWEEIVR